MITRPFPTVMEPSMFIKAGEELNLDINFNLKSHLKCPLRGQPCECKRMLWALRWHAWATEVSPLHSMRPLLSLIWHLPSPLMRKITIAEVKDVSAADGNVFLLVSLPALPPYKLWQRSALIPGNCSFQKAISNGEARSLCPHNEGPCRSCVIPFQWGTAQDHHLLVTASFKCLWLNFHSIIPVNTLTMGDFSTAFIYWKEEDLQRQTFTQLLELGSPKAEPESQKFYLDPPKGRC